MNTQLYILALFTSLLFFGVSYGLYPYLPDEIIAFKFNENESVLMTKSILSVMRLPVMDLALLGIMYFIHLHEKNIEDSDYRDGFNIFWSGLIGVWIIKILFQLFELVGQSGVISINLSFTTTILFGIVLILLFSTIIRSRYIYTKYNSKHWKIKSQNKFNIIYLLLVYVVFVLMPFWYTY